MMNPNTPVLVGVGQLVNRIESLEEAVEPIEMMLRASELAERDTGAGGVLRQVGSVRVIRRTNNKMFFFWKIATPGTVVDNIFYYYSFEFPTIVQIPFDIGALAKYFRFRVSVDGNENQRGKKFINTIIG